LSKKPVIKRLFGTKSKRTSKKGKVGIRKSSSESDMEIEFENEDSGDDISDGDAKGLHCKGLFSRDKHGGKWAQHVKCYRWANEDCGVEEDYSMCPMFRKSVRIVSYIMKYLPSHIRTPFLFERKVNCSRIFCTETCVLLQTVFVTVSE